MTVAEHWFGAVGTAIEAGQVIDGACVSLTVTVNMQVVVICAASVAVQETEVVPFGKVAPDAGEQMTDAPQLSDAVGVV